MRAPRSAAALLALLSLAAATDCADDTCGAGQDQEEAALLQHAAARANTTETTTLTCYPNQATGTCGNPSLPCFLDTTGCTSTGGGTCCAAAGQDCQSSGGNNCLQCRFCSCFGEDLCADFPSPTPAPPPTSAPPAPTPAPGYCGNTGKQCSQYEVCVGSMHSYACAGSCATNEACGPGDSAGSCPTCADRVQTLTDNLMLATEAMDSVACSYSSCRCMKDFCGNLGYPCCGGEVCVGGMKSYACAGPCATNEACGPGDSPGSCPTCADRVKTLVDNGMGVNEAMASVGQNYGWTEPGCSCMR